MHADRNTNKDGQQRRPGFKRLGAGGCKFPTEKIWKYKILILSLDSPKIGGFPAQNCVFWEENFPTGYNFVAPATPLLVSVKYITCDTFL